MAEAALKAKPDDLNARFARASAYFQLGENPKAIDDLNAVIKKAPQATVADQSRALAHARLGHKDEALADLVQFQKGDSTESSRLYLAVVVAAELGEGTDQAFEKLDAALQKQPQDAGLHYNAACAYALASQPLSKKEPAKGRDCRSEPSTCSRRRSRTASPTTTTCRKTPTSTPSVIFRRSLRS